MARRPEVAGLQPGLVRVDVQRHHPPRVDPDDLRRRARERRHLGRGRLGLAPDLQELDVGWPHTRGVVYDQRDQRLPGHVAVLRALGHVQAVDVDRAELVVVGVTDRFVLRAAVGADRGQRGQPVPGQELLLRLGE